VWQRDHSAQWVIRLGDGTEGSRRRMIDGFQLVWPMVSELFVAHPVEQRLSEIGYAVDPSAVRGEVITELDEILSVACLDLPDLRPTEAGSVHGGRFGVHTGAFEFVLAEMQYLRSEPIAAG
jgi:ring-1,2-phenylacetyl-CoA epoxidase subunit PaaC